MVRYTSLPLSQQERFENELLVVHEREGEKIDRPIVIFVHGFNGRAYRTWAAVLRSRWLSADQSCDVGLLGYVSGVARYIRWFEPDPIDVANSLADEIGQMSPRRVVLVGHSMGGLIARQTYRRLHERYGADSVQTRAVLGVITICTPHTGSDLVRLFFGPGGGDRIMLKKYSRAQRELEEFYATWVDPTIGRDRGEVSHLPAFASSARKDRIVTPMGASVGVPAAQRAELPGNHRTVLKSQSTFAWLERTIATIIEPRKPLAKFTNSSITAEFNGSADHSNWEGAYRRALLEYAREHGNDVVNDLPLGAGYEPDLAIRAYPAFDYPPSFPLCVVNDIARQESSSWRLALGISPVGKHARDAEKLLTAEANAPRLRWFMGVSDDEDDLVAVFLKYLKLATGVHRTTRARPSQFTLGGHSDEF